MLKSEILKQDKTGALPERAQADHHLLRHVLACVDPSSFADAVLAHAAAVAGAARARLTVLRILETSSGQSPMDPVEWTMRHQDMAADLAERVSHLGGLHTDAVINTVIEDGLAAERICAWARDNAVDLVVLGRCGESNGSFAGLGSTTRRVTEVVTGSVLIVPSPHVADPPIRYRRVLMPLDGSSRSECALPLGLGIAAAHAAEIVLMHAAPTVDLTEVGPAEAETITLRDRLRRRNEFAGERYLQRILSRLPPLSVTRARVLPSGDPRHGLARAAMEEHADLMVLSCTGQGGHPDMSIGSVADYLINHMDIPVLLVRGRDACAPVAHGQSGAALSARLPSRALM